MLTKKKVVKEKEKVKKEPSFSFVVPLMLYPFDVLVSVGQNEDQLGRVLDKMPALTHDDIKACAYPSPFVTGRAVMFTTNVSIIRLRKLPVTSADFGTLAHEVFHIVTFVMDRVGMSFNLGTSDEAYAYLTGYLTEQIYKGINKYY
jgi:hypothetical protein